MGPCVKIFPLIFLFGRLFEIKLLIVFSLAVACMSTILKYAV